MTRTATFKGLLGTKLGMTQIFDENARVVPVTVIQAGPCTVTQVKSPERDGYSAVQLAFGDVKAKRVNKPRAGQFAKAGVEPRRHLVELRTADAGEYTLGQELKADVFAPGDRVDVVVTDVIMPRMNEVNSASWTLPSGSVQPKYLEPQPTSATNIAIAIPATIEASPHRR